MLVLSLFPGIGLLYQEINEGRLEACKVRGRTVIIRDALAAWRESLPRARVPFLTLAGPGSASHPVGDVR